MNVQTRYTFLIALILILTTFAFSGFKKQQKIEPWTQDQLLEPGDLAKTLNNPQAKQPYIFSVGPAATIKTSIDIGPARDKENLNKLALQLDKLPKDADIVIYCGCCPFDRCPNIRPAFKLLNEMKFKNQKLLTLTQNVKVDWIDHGYPTNN
ncbi:MAG: rhodanese-like domain-containing protein [Parafilimonas sp.]